MGRLIVGRGGALVGVIWLLGALGLWWSAAGVIAAGHPAYAVALGGTGLLGAGLLAWAVARGRRTVRSVRRRGRVLRGIAAGVVTALVLGALVWLRPFAAAPEAVAAMRGADGVALADTATRITLTPARAPRAGLVFQPGARVDPRAYVPLLTRVAASGFLVVIVKQPLGIGFLATGESAAVRRDHPEVTRWAVGGHSLGGVVSAADAGRPDVAGLVLWASYPASSLADRSGLAVMSISGSQDGLSTPATIQAARTLLPSTTTYVVVDGAVHAYFGDYGPQPGDGTPTVAREPAQARIVEATVVLLDAIS